MSTAVTDPNPDQPDTNGEPGKPASTDKPDNKRPDSVQLAIKVWLFALILEAIHQILQVTSTLIDPADLIYAAREQQEDAGEPMADELINFATYGSIIGLGFINLAFVVILLVALRFYSTGHKLAGGARSLLMVFSIFFVLRAIFAFSAVPSGTNVPDWLLLLVGSLQIVLAVAAVLGVVFSSRKEALEYTGETQIYGGSGSNDKNKRK